ncbi:hypothetical protein [Parazoarcus communis]|uniref:hypothetical protein n=1 Tax=Parazoarcus communis TaxID=41977 RepID=UPI001459AF8F|nr:hypothetical protein [Parazoarcus communis]
MTSKGRLHGLDGWIHYKLLDTSTYRGCLQSLLVCCALTYLLWHTHNLYVWWDSLWGISSSIDPGKQAWARLWAIIIGGSGILASIGAMIMIPINRRRAIKSAEGQWYDDPALTREMLHADESPAQAETERKVRPEPPEIPAQWAQEPTPTHLIVNSSIPEGPRNGLQVERRGGRATLVVSEVKPQATVPGAKNQK